MANTQLKLVGLGLSFVLIFLSGYRLARTGKPYSGIILTIHKLVSLAGVALLVLVMVQTSRVARLRTIELAAGAVTGALLLGTIATGGLSSVDRPTPTAVWVLHKITPYLTVLFSAATLYLVLGRG
jgi:hypothetical protein